MGQDCKVEDCEIGRIVNEGLSGECVRLRIVKDGWSGECEVEDCEERKVRLGL